MNPAFPIAAAGRGSAIWRSYDEVIAAVDRAYAVPADEPLPTARVLAELTAAPAPVATPECEPGI